MRQRLRAAARTPSSANPSRRCACGFAGSSARMRRSARSSAVPCSSPDVTCAMSRRELAPILRIGARRRPAIGRRRRSRAPAAAPRVSGSAAARSPSVATTSSAPRARAAPSACAGSAAARSRVFAGVGGRRRYSSGARRLDVLPAVLTDAAERAPAEVEQRRERLGVERRGRTSARRWSAGVRSTPSASNARQSDSRASGRRDVDQRHRRVRPRRGPIAGPGDDQRHPQRRVVDEDAVADLAVLAERFAVIRRDDDQRPVGRARRAPRAAARPADPPPPPRRHSARRPGGVSVGVAVRRVRLEQVDPEEEPCRSRCARSHADRLVHDHAARAARWRGRPCGPRGMRSP